MNFGIIGFDMRMGMVMQLLVVGGDGSLIDISFGKWDIGFIFCAFPHEFFEDTAELMEGWSLMLCAKTTIEYLF